MLILGGALLLLFALLSLSGPGTGLGTERLEHLALGTLGACAIVFFAFRAGLPWLVLGLPLLWNATRRRGDGRAKSSDASAARGRAAHSGSTSVPAGKMTRDEALRVLGLEPGVSREHILTEYRRLMKKVHPDVGGTNYLASRINEAKDTLLEG